jgi:hypothetical protein
MTRVLIAFAGAAAASLALAQMAQAAPHRAGAVPPGPAVPAAPPTAPPPSAAPPAARPAPVMAAPGAVYVMQQMRTAPLPADLMEKMKPLNTLQQVEDLLKINRISFAWALAEVRSETMPADLVAQIERLPPHEPFIVPQKAGVVILAIDGVRRGGDNPAPGP